MKRLFILSVVLALMLGCARGDPYEWSQETKEAARRASVQTVFDIPVLKASFTSPLEEPLLTLVEINTLLQQKIKEAIDAERELQAKDKYSSFLTSIINYGFKPYSPMAIPLGAMTPKWAKFPENVLVVYKTEKKDITAWEKEFEQDILTISETANVSPTQAKTIVSRLKTDGYSIRKETTDPDSTVELFWFQSGWADTYPTKLGWSVSIEGSDTNIIRGYDPRGIIEVSSIPEDSRVNVTAGYFDLKDEFKPKTEQVERLENEIEQLKKDLKAVEKKLLEGKKPEKRDIGEATRMDVVLGTVKLETFYIKSPASGVFLGNMKVAEKVEGWHSSWGYESHNMWGEQKGVILTNAHVASMAIDFFVMVSKDKEVMYIVFPAESYVRYTQDSDTRGTPAQLLHYDRSPIMSWDYDCAIMVTTAVPQYEQHKAVLGDSDKVKEGDPVVMVGNPMLMQKFLTSGVVSNTSYNIMKSGFGDEILKKGLSRKWYNWLINGNFWFDTPIGIGGTSGSGVWAVSGSEKGKVVALHNSGMSAETSVKDNAYVFLKIEPSLFSDTIIKDGPLRSILKNYRSELFGGIGISSADEMVKDDVFSKLLQEHGRTDVAGMNAGVPINKVKQYLQERGLNPNDFGWAALKPTYWIK